MGRVVAVTAGLAALAAVVAGCSSSGSSTTGGAPTSATGAAVLKTAASPEGQILVDGSGRTLYLFRADTGTTSTCVGACAVAWPPDTTVGAPQQTGLTASLLGSSTRADKSVQVTYAGHPLYRFANDAKAGDVNGQGVTAFGGTWYVVGPDGAAITTAAPAPSTPSSSGGGYGGY